MVPLGGLDRGHPLLHRPCSGQCHGPSAAELSKNPTRSPSNGSIPRKSHSQPGKLQQTLLGIPCPTLSPFGQTLSSHSRSHEGFPHGLCYPGATFFATRVLSDSFVSSPLSLLFLIFRPLLPMIAACSDVLFHLHQDFFIFLDLYVLPFPPFMTRIVFLVPRMLLLSDPQCIR